MLTLLPEFLFVLFGGLFVGVPLAMWRWGLRAARDRWLPRPGSVERVDRGAFCEAHLRGMVAAGPPGVVHAAALGCWCLGAPLLRGEPSAAARATEAAQFARLLNYVVLGVCATVATYLCDEWHRHATRYDRFIDTLGLMLSIAFYACVSLVHARLLVRAAAAIDAEQPRRAAGSS